MLQFWYLLSSFLFFLLIEIVINNWAEYKKNEQVNKMLFKDFHEIGYLYFIELFGFTIKRLSNGMHLWWKYYQFSLFSMHLCNGQIMTVSDTSTFDCDQIEYLVVLIWSFDNNEASNLLSSITFTKFFNIIQSYWVNWNNVPPFYILYATFP